MRLLLVFARAYPWQSSIVLGCLLFAALAEGAGISSAVPLLSLAFQTGSATSLDPPQVPQPKNSWLEQTVHNALDGVGLQPSIGLLCLLVISGMTLKAGFVLLAQRQVGYTVAHVATDLRLALIRALLAARWEYYVRQPVGSFANAFATEATRASQAYLEGATIIALLLQTVLYIALALVVSWQATLGAIVIGVLVVYALNRLVRMARRAGARQTTLLKTLLGRLTDVLYTVKPLKAMGRAIFIGPLLEKETYRLNRAIQREVLSKEMLRALQEPLVIVALMSGLYMGFTYWALSLDTILMLALLFERTLSGLNKVQREYQSMVARESAFWSLRDTIDRAETAHEVTYGRAKPILHNEITFKNVSFSYGDHLILQNSSFRIPAGQLTAIVGPSGVGKTTTADLIIGLMQPQTGEIWIDNIPLRTVDLQYWRRAVGYVPQETLLLHESICVNVALGDPQVAPADVEFALRAAGAWGFVSALPEGMHTLVGERGTRFSGGQRQRIAIARALVHRPQLLILDEATASLDPESEAAVWKTVQQLRGQMTILAISHQPALLEAADVIYHLEAATARRLDCFRSRMQETG